MTIRPERLHPWLRAALWLAGLAFALQVLHAAFSGSLPMTTGVISQYLWGRVMLVDLYLGFLLALGLLWGLETRRPYLLLLAPLLLVFGNLALCWYLAWRYPALFQRDRSRPLTAR